VEVGRGFQTDDGKQVVLTDEELSSVQPEKTRTIDVQSFVDLEDVDPIYFDNTWFLVPAGDSQGTRRAYRLLVEVMEDTERAALGRFVMRTKEYLVLVRPRDGLLSLTTMRFHDEVRPTDGIAPGGRKPAKHTIEQAVAVIESLGAEWEPKRYTDCYRERLQRVVKQKQKGERVKAPVEPKQPKPAPDLMEALQATLERMGSSKGDGRGKAKASREKATA
jgi:DNA end-binding protein Ku